MLIRFAGPTWISALRVQDVGFRLSKCVTKAFGSRFSIGVALGVRFCVCTNKLKGRVAR